VRHLAEQAGLTVEVTYQQQVSATVQGEAEPLAQCLAQLREQTRGELELLDTDMDS